MILNDIIINNYIIMEGLLKKNLLLLEQQQ